MSNENNIDFVILWVDGNDEKWIEDRNKYSNNPLDKSVNRFRDWKLLKYWFRSIEKNANWVNNIYFITYGHLPKWLNTENKKLKIINHKDYIPEKYLPTFNSNVIELNIAKIKELSEKFILFNDDVFLMNKVEKEDFFDGNKVKDIFIENPILATKDPYNYTQYNNMAIINENYDKKKYIKNKKYYNFKYGKRSLSSFIESKHEKFVGFLNQHITQPYLKSSFEKIWKIAKKECEETSNSKFRAKNNISHYAIRYMQMLDNKFEPRNLNFGKSFELSENNDIIYNEIKSIKYKVICINDSNPNIDFENTKEKLIKLFEEKFPNKSKFEK